MRVTAELTWVEAKLFLREPVTVVFTLALPPLLLLVMAKVFGNTPDAEGRYYGVYGPMTFYTRVLRRPRRRLGAVLPTARGAQGPGVLTVLLIVAGAGGTWLLRRGT